MSYPKPPLVRVGMSCTLGGRRFSVVGRVVLGVDVDRQTYYWNEFNLVDAAGTSLTLVYEETDDGGDWKMFKLLEPVHPISAGAAAKSQVGDSVEFEGRQARITMVDQSRVYQIEGTAPEGVEMGDVADYFNAESGIDMYVASWTGDEIEFYKGRTITTKRLCEAFGLPQRQAESPSFPKFLLSFLGTNFWVLLIITVFLFNGFISMDWGRKSTSPPPSKLEAPALRLASGAQGLLDHTTYTVSGHKVVDVAEIEGKFARLEYDLTDPNGDHALLVHGLDRKKPGWHLFKPVTPPKYFTPYDAAAKRRQDKLLLDGHFFQVDRLFLCRPALTGRTTAASSWPESVQYGFIAHENAECLLARWTESGIEFHLGHSVNETEVLGALDKRKN